MVAVFLYREWKSNSERKEAGAKVLLRQVRPIKGRVELLNEGGEICEAPTPWIPTLLHRWLELTEVGGVFSQWDDSTKKDPFLLPHESEKRDAMMKTPNRGFLVLPVKESLLVPRASLWSATNKTCKEASNHGSGIRYEIKVFCQNKSSRGDEDNCVFRDVYKHLSCFLWPSRWPAVLKLPLKATFFFSLLWWDPAVAWYHTEAETHRKERLTGSPPGYNQPLGKRFDTSADFCKLSGIKPSALCLMGAHRPASVLLLLLSTYSQQSRHTKCKIKHMSNLKGTYAISTWTYQLQFQNDPVISVARPRR